MKNIKHKKEKLSNIYEKKETPEITESQLYSAFKFNSFGDSIPKYLEICRSEGFPVTLRKKFRDLELEAIQYRNNLTKTIFKKNNNIKKISLLNFIEKVDLGELKSNESLKYEDLYNIYIKLSETTKEDFKLFAKLFKSVKIEGKITRTRVTGNILNNREVTQDKNPTTIIIENIFENKDSWINKLSDFKLKTKNIDKAIDSLVEFLFIKYKIETPLFSLIKNSNKKHSKMFFDIIGGEKPKKVFERVIPDIVKLLSKKQIHSLLSNPSKRSFFARCREVMLEDKNPKIWKAVSVSSKIENFNENEKTFQEFIIYLENNEEDLNFFSVDQIMPLFDYVITKKNRANNLKVLFRLKDHTLAKLYEEMIQWHRSLGKSKYDFEWESLGMDYYDVTKRTTTNGLEETKENVILELTSGKDLRDEGSKMKHCVASYSRSCKEGNCAIFSLRMKDYNSDSFKIKATIEVRNNNVVQIKAKNNTKVIDSDFRIISDWSKETGVNIASYY
jgi:hypothetical protein